jgi:pimeloyl-ACP methyl ester carboxylesterase
MLAALLGLTLAAEITTYFLLFGALFRHSWAKPSALLVIICIALSWRVFLVVTTFALSGFFRRSERKLSTIAAEFWVMLKLYTVQQPLAPFGRFWHNFTRSPQTASAGTRSRNGQVIVLVHGFVCNAGMWSGVRRALRGAGWARVHAVTLEPFYLSMPSSLAAFEAKLRRILAAEQAHEAVLIGHSMGGVLARVFQRKHPDLVRAAVSIGAPHAGTDLARLVSTIHTGPLRPDSRWLTQFNETVAQERAQSHGGVASSDTRALISLNIWSDADNIVFPQAHASEHAAGGAMPDVALNGIGHLHLAFSPRALNPMLEFIAKLDPA